MRLEGTVHIIKTAGKKFYEDDAFMRAAALAFYSVLSLAPLLVIFVSVTGFLGEDAQANFIKNVQTLIGPETSEAIKSVVAYASENRTAGVISAAISAFTSVFWTTVVFAQLQLSLNRMWGIRARPGRATWFLLRKRLLSLAVVATIGLLLLASVILTAVLTMIFPGTVNIWVVGNLVVPILLFTVLFKVLPDVRIAWKDVWAGALVTAILLAIGKLLLGKYLVYRGIGSAYGAAGSLVVFLVWVYYVSLVALFGGQLTRAYAIQSGSTVVPLRHARWAGNPVPEDGIPGSRSGDSPG